MRQHDFQAFFGSILGSFWAPKGVGNGAQVGPRSDPNRRQKRRCEKKLFKIVLGRSWGGLGAVLERSWAILAELEAILGRFGVRWGGRNRCFSLRFSMFFAKALFGVKMIIFAGLGAILAPLGGILGPLGPILARFGRPRGFKREPKTTPRCVQNDIVLHHFLRRICCDLAVFKEKTH